MAECVKNGVGDDARFVTRAKDTDVVFIRECLRRLTQSTGHIRKGSARRNLRNDLPNLATGPRMLELNDRDKTDHAKNCERREYSENLGKTLHVCKWPSAKVSDGCQPPPPFDSSVSEAVGSHSLDRLVR